MTPPQDTPAPNCRRCNRLVALRRQLRQSFPDYHGGPVPAVGPADARLLVVGLAPGLHGAHRTGRPFSGDNSGTLLFEALHAHGFANQPYSNGPGDGLALHDCRITNALKCLPPGNLPKADELNTCARFLGHELLHARVILTLGGVAHRRVLKTLALRQRDYRFVHGRIHEPATGPVIIDSYHCSRYNLNTGRLTRPMFFAVIASARRCLSSSLKDTS